MTDEKERGLGELAGKPKFLKEEYKRRTNQFNQAEQAPWGERKSVPMIVRKSK